MAQDETNVDTPQEGSNLSVEEAFFSNNDDSAAGVTNTSTDVVNSIAPAQEDASPAQPTENNDERRYQYWQSEADKVKNENNSLKQQMDQMQATQNVMQQQAQQAPVKETQSEQFPPPPAKPEAPVGFNRAEAMEDSTSPSARYLDSVESWRDDMTEYSQLKSDYNTAVVQEQMEAEQNRRVENAKRVQAQQKVNKQVNDVYNQVQGEYGLNPEEAKSFVNDMSKPDSLSMDNLVELWRIKSGSGAPLNSQPAQPSPTFQQQARAQQVASPMGVLPAQQPAEVSTEDSIIDSMISGYKKNNPW